MKFFLSFTCLDLKEDRQVAIEVANR